MRLHEYQSKQVFSKHGIPIPRGRMASSLANVRQIAEELGSRVVIKAQVLSGGRGKAGGVLLAETPESAEILATKILSMTINRLPVHKVLVDEAVNIEKELYLGLTIDREISLPVMIASAQGGMDIEETAQKSPNMVIKSAVPLLLGLREYQVRSLASAIDLPRKYWRQFYQIANGLWQIFRLYDVTMVEINPLVITMDSSLLALDGKIEIDDNSLFRHPELIELRDLDTEDPVEIEARKVGLAYIRLKGEVGCMVNGAGLAMATMDLVKHYGGEPANFLDVGGGAGAEKVAAAFRLILSDPKVKSVLVNIFGGITRCDEVAKGIIRTLNEIQTKIPIVIRLEGNHAMEARKLLSERNIQPIVSFSEAAECAVKLAQGIE
jgi:succinyl-CoA synthetase beta subunit